MTAKYKVTIERLGDGYSEKTERIGAAGIANALFLCLLESASILDTTPLQIASLLSVMIVNDNEEHNELTSPEINLRGAAGEVVRKFLGR